MLTSIAYGSIANYSPRGTSQLSVNSRKACDSVKAGRPQSIESAVKYLSDPIAECLQPFLDKETTFVPVPRSSLLSEGAVWPAKTIAEILLKSGYGKEVASCLARSYAIRKSSLSYTADSRPTVKDHYDSIAVTPVLSTPTKITLVDDVLTLGRTSFACAQRLKEAFPDAEIRVLVVVRTQGFIPEVLKIVDPSTGEISYNQNSGKTTRTP